MLDADGWDRRYAAKERVFSIEPTPIVMELVSALEPARALDLAAGEGRHAVWLAQRGWQVTAVDFSGVGLEKAAARAAELGVEIDCVQADLYDYQPAAEGFDLALIAYMHPEPGQRAAVFEAATRALAPGGHLLIVGRDVADVSTGCGPSDPDRRFSVERLADALPPALELERCEQVTRERDATEGPRRLVDTFAWARRPLAPQTDADQPAEKVSDQLERWLRGDRKKTLGSLIDLFGERGFAIVFVVLMALPALPVPTGGATHVLEVITGLLALELIVGRREVWLPQRFQRFELGGTSRQKFVTMLLARIRWLERFSRPRGRWLFRHRVSGMVFGLVVLGLTATAFLSPPFSGLDTLPSIGVVLLALGVLVEDYILAAAGLVVGALGVVAVIWLGNLVADALKQLF